MEPEVAQAALQLISRANISVKEAEAAVAVKQALMKFIPAPVAEEEEAPKKDSKKDQ